ncbi:MAG: DUF3592 domain-containing protein [Desulfotalea sp.]
MTKSSEEKFSPETIQKIRKFLPPVILFLGICIVLVGIQSLIKAKESVNWPTAEGVVVSSDIYDSKDENDSASKSVYHAKVIYEFSVNGTLYSSDVVAFGDYGSADESHASDIVGRYSTGENVTVYYQHNDPDECLLEPGLAVQSFFIFGFGLVFFIAGIYLVFFFPKANTNKNDES